MVHVKVWLKYDLTSRKMVGVRGQLSQQQDLLKQPWIFYGYSMDYTKSLAEHTESWRNSARLQHLWRELTSQAREWRTCGIRGHRRPWRRSHWNVDIECVKPRRLLDRICPAALCIHSSRRVLLKTLTWSSTLTMGPALGVPYPVVVRHAKGSAQESGSDSEA
ncbi:uncharacterized protein LOC132380419 isoform X3 [Hypanus sabinus]|uniref:uncharacterized protein LOC132380419 isoform X3 n=1 Tax=Hypanus sabinus TaxID=79690 RepID=UPI0028C3DD53|nr:uncharacterized protein LOC132380419 isoform X3 [Hypanus sabinus]